MSMFKQIQPDDKYKIQMKFWNIANTQTYLRVMSQNQVRRQQFQNFKGNRENKSHKRTTKDILSMSSNKIQLWEEFAN